MNMEHLNYEVYGRLPKRDKLNSSTKSAQKCGRDRSSTKVKNAADAPATVLLHPAPKPKSSHIGQRVSKLKKSVSKELICESMADAMIEKEKPAKTRSSTPLNQKGKPWGSLLKSNDNTPFDNCDPLRTLHFLLKEMQHKVKTEVPESKNLTSIVNDMLATINRVPTELSSLIQLTEGEIGKSMKKSRSSSSKTTKAKENDLHFLKNHVTDKSVQTLSTRLYDEMLSKEMEVTTAKLEASYKQMEHFCERINTEKQELERMLRVEKDNNAQLRQQLQDTKHNNDRATLARIKRLEDEKEELALQLEKLKVFCDSQKKSPSAQELKALVQELRSQKLAAEQETLNVKHHVTLLDLEKEKYKTLLDVRERQMQEIRAEMNQLQEVVNHQLTELQNHESSIQISSTLLDQCLSCDVPALDCRESKDMSDHNGTLSSINTEPNLNELYVKHENYNIPSGDSSNIMVRELEKLDENTYRNVMHHKASKKHKK